MIGTTVIVQLAGGEEVEALVLLECQTPESVNGAGESVPAAPSARRELNVVHVSTTESAVTPYGRGIVVLQRVPHADHRQDADRAAWRER